MSRIPALPLARPVRLPLAAALALAVGLGQAQGVAAQASGEPPAISVSIPAMPLGAALNELARQAGLQLSFPATAVAGKTAPALSARLTPRQALERLLAGSGLVADQQGTVVVVRPAPAAPAAETRMPAIVVSAPREPLVQPGLRIDAREIERRNASDLQDLFQGQPGVQVGSSLPVSQKVYVNGVEETNLAVSIDGSRQNNKIFHHNATHLIDPTLLKAVRIDPGVAPADAGPGAVAGAIAYETVDATDLLQPGRGHGALLRLGYESNGDITTPSGALFGKAGGLEYLGHLKQSNGGLRRDGSGTVIVGSGTGLASGLAKLAYQATSGDRIELSYESVNDDEARPYRADMGRVIGGRPVPLTRNYDLHRRNAVLRYSDRTPQGLWDPRIQLAHSVTDLVIAETEQISSGRTSSLNGRLENRFALPLGSVTAGVDFYADEAGTDYRSLTNPRFDEAGAEKARNLGLYAQARLDMGERVRLSFGGRADRQRFTGVDGAQQRDSGFSYNLSGEVDLARGITASAGYADVWAGVPLAENFIINPAWTYTAGLQAVGADNAQIGLRAELGNAAGGPSFEARAFRTRIDDARTPDYRLGPSLRRSMSSRGYELGAGYRWRDGFARLRFTDIDTRIDGNPSESYTGRYLTTPIGRIVGVELAQDLEARRWSMGLTAQFVLEEKNTFVSDTGQRGQPLPAYEVVNVYAEHRPAALPGLTLRAEVANLFDRSHASRATYGQEYDDVVPLREPGRVFKLLLTYRF
jgi:hemoglobin/transferrin/lactoferrin receptor protein